MIMSAWHDEDNMAPFPFRAYHEDDDEEEDDEDMMIPRKK
jgi:hypothetical protein